MNSQKISLHINSWDYLSALTLSIFRYCTAPSQPSNTAPVSSRVVVVAVVPVVITAALTVIIVIVVLRTCRAGTKQRYVVDY